MFECCDNPPHICQFPTELIMYIFKFLSAKNLFSCRQVCKRWKEIVDDVSSDENMWEKHCKRDFGSLYKGARTKSTACHLWFDIYRSLKLWGRLTDATEVRDEFCHSLVHADQIQDLCILKNGVVSVHKTLSVVYYDMATLEVSDRDPVCGEFTKFLECDDALVMLGEQLHLSIVRKLKPHNEESASAKQEPAVYRFTRYFLMFKNVVYFVNFNNTISYFDIDKDVKATHMPRTFDETVIALSFYNGSLHVLTAERILYCYENNTFVKLLDLECKKNNLLDFLWRYEFIENIDWRIIYFWMTNLRLPIPDGPLRYICILKVYGDTFFIGCKNGVVLIYYKPFVDGQLNFYSHKPVKQYNFAEREDIPVLSLHPILKIDIEEIKGGHKVFIAMPKKVIIVTYTHNFEVVESKAVIPYVPPGPVVSA